MYLSERLAAAPRVLVVDDNADAADSLVLLLDLWGAEVRPAYHAAEALVVARAFHPDVALLDIGMPGIDGLELGRALVAEGLCTWPAVAAVTGFAHLAGRCHRLGFGAFFVKPVDAHALRDFVLGRSRPHGAPSERSSLGDLGGLTLPAQDLEEMCGRAAPPEAP